MKVVTGEKDADASDSTAFDDLGFETSDEEFASRGAGNEIVLVAEDISTTENVVVTPKRGVLAPSSPEVVSGYP